MDKFMKLFKKEAEEAAATFQNDLQSSEPLLKNHIAKFAGDIDPSEESFEKEEEILKEFTREYLLSRVIPIASPADEDDEKLITIEEPNLMGIKFGFAIVRKLDDDGKFEAGYLGSNALDELGIELAELIRHAEQNINPMIKVEKFSDIPELAFYFLQVKVMKKLGELPDDVDPEMPICKITTSFGKASGALMSTELPEMLKQQLNTDSFYVMPSSVYELVAVPGYYVKGPKDVKRLTDAVKRINRDIVIPNEEKDFLSDNIYFFDGVKYSTIINFPTT